MDRTYLAVKRQLDGMACERFSVGVLQAAGIMVQRENWLPATVIKSIPFFKAENAKKSAVFIRPSKPQEGLHDGLIMLDDLPLGTVEKMRVEGFVPAALVETSPQNFQVWLRLSVEPIPRSLALRATQALGKRYDSDPGAANAGQYGRLAGFRNHKPEHCDDSGFGPYVLCHAAPGKVAAAAQGFLADLERGGPAVAPPATLVVGHQEGEGRGLSLALETYERKSESIENRFSADLDISRLDWMVTLDMLREGFSQDEIYEAMQQVSPALRARKIGHIENYINRTIRGAAAKLAADAATKLEL